MNSKPHHPVNILGAEASRLALRGLEPPQCLTLRKMRTDLGLTLASVCSLYSLVQVLALMGDLGKPEGCAVIEFASARVSLDILLAANIQNLFGQVDNLDITHLSKFERGDQVPWTRARARLTFLFSLIHGKQLLVKEVFPELEGFPGLQSGLGDTSPESLLEI